MNVGWHLVRKGSRISLRLGWAYGEGGWEGAYSECSKILRLRGEQMKPQNPSAQMSLRVHGEFLAPLQCGIPLGH